VRAQRFERLDSRLAEGRLASGASDERRLRHATFLCPYDKDNVAQRNLSIASALGITWKKVVGSLDLSLGGLRLWVGNPEFLYHLDRLDRQPGEHLSRSMAVLLLYCHLAGCDFRLALLLRNV
jgi:hypothetical protein